MKGFTTIHAGSARQALTRLRFIAQLSDVASELPLSALNTLVSEAVDLVVHTERTAAGPRITQIVAVEDLAGGVDAAQFTATDVFERDAATNELVWTGQLPVRLDVALRRAGFDMRDLLSNGGVPR